MYVLHTLIHNSYEIDRPCLNRFLESSLYQNCKQSKRMFYIFENSKFFLEVNIIFLDYIDRLLRLCDTF